MMSLSYPAKWLSLVNIARSGALIMGGAVIALAALSFFTKMNLSELLSWAQKMFGWGFALIFVGLTVVGINACLSIGAHQKRDYYWELAQQMGNGIATLALTFTLLGISMGIGSLSGQSLHPDTIQNIISQLTGQFSSAFMTTVVGLPTATALRAWSSIRLQASIKNQTLLEE